MYDDPTIWLVIGAAVHLLVIAVVGAIIMARRLWRRNTAHRQAIDAFLAELKQDAAWAEVTERPAYSGGDILHMLRDHRLIDQMEYDALLLKAEEWERRAADRPAFANAHDAEIPF